MGNCWTQFSKFTEDEFLVYCYQRMLNMIKLSILFITYGYTS